MKKYTLLVVLCGALSACYEKPSDALGASSAEKSPIIAEAAPVVIEPAPNVTAPSNLPDVGKIEQVKVSAKGTGLTPGAAINNALKTAVMQVNGVTIDAASANINVTAQVAATVDINSSEGHDSAQLDVYLQGQKFAEYVLSQTSGVVSTFKVLNITNPSATDKNYIIDIEASVAKFKAPADAGKVKIVIAPLRTKQSSFNIGGRSVPADEVLAPLQRQIVDALAQTGRFLILDRQFEAEIDAELDMISSGKTNNSNMAKLGQALSADLVWVGEVDALAYNKNVRKLQTSERDLVSYSGGWQVSQRLINLTTRQLYQSNTLKGTLPAIAPTTLSRGINAPEILQNMQADIVKQAAESIILRSFPISVIERTGTQVVLSQGGAILKENSRYQVYLQGKELVDPQTGQSLGKMESPCCEVVINRVTPTISYATLENIQIPLDQIQVKDLLLKEALLVSKAVKLEQQKEAELSAEAPKAKPARKAAAAKAPEPAPSPKKERDDW